MVKRRRDNRLHFWEIAIIKAMLEQGKFGNDQDILAYFTRPTRSINHRAIAEIRTGSKHSRAKPADQKTLDRFLADWPNIDPKTGLHIGGDELLLKSREAMLAAVQTYNNPSTLFKSEIFIVTAIIAWTYLLHAYFKREGVDYRYTKKNDDGDDVILTTKHGADKHWELDQCLSDARCPLDNDTKNNLKFLIEVRHEIEHQMTTRIDGAISAKLQACALNYSHSLEILFGFQFGLNKELSMAIQFSSIDPEQKDVLLDHTNLPPNIETMRDTFEAGLSEEEYCNPKYAYRVIFVPKIANTKGQADRAVEFVKAGSDQAEEMNKTYLKEVDKARYRPGNVVAKMNAAGFPKFNMTNHTDLWKALDAKNPTKGYGIETESDGWRWYERWVDAVLQHCEENREKYE